MNSVMDDNKLLTLANGERIRLQKHVALLFEVGDLQYASPATVSRAGMVYVDPKNLGYRPYFTRWTITKYQSQQERELLQKLFEKYVPRLIDYIFEGNLAGFQEAPLRCVICTSSMAMTTQLCNLLYPCLADIKSIADAAVVEAMFIQSVIWSLGAVLAEKDRFRLSEAVKKISELSISLSADSCGATELPPAGTSLFDYRFDPETNSWCPWSRYVPQYVHQRHLPFYEVLVPTPETVKHIWLMQKLVASKKPVLFVGGTGTSKTATIENFLRGLAAEKYLRLSVNFSSRTNSMDVQKTIESVVEKRTKDTFGPPGGKTMIFFIDDLNMPSKDKYGTQQPIALLKLLVEKGGFYDRGKELNWKNIKDIQFIAAMGEPGGGRHEVDSRLVSLFNVFNIPFPADQSLINIYQSILGGHLEIFADEIKALTPRLTTMTLKLYNEIVGHLPPTPAKFHYVFNLRDISRIYEGLLLSTPDLIKTVPQMFRLWRNECLRVLHDRLINVEDKQFVQNTIATLISENMVSADREYVIRDPILFGDYRKAIQPDSLRLYEDLLDYDASRAIVAELLEEYVEKMSGTRLVLFDDALEHLTRIHRVIRLQKGHCLLVGIGGSGKQSLVRLASFIAGYSVFEITLRRGYGEAEFREELKVLYTKVGPENKKVVFLFSDGHVAQEGFLELINGMLTSGVIPTLYAEDEKDAVLNSIRDDAAKEGIQTSKESLWQYFVERCSRNLHVALCFSPTGDKLRTRCRNFPGLVNNTVIDWFMPWPQQALTAVADVYLGKANVDKALQKCLVQHMVNVHLSAIAASNDYMQRWRRINHVTPKNFLDYIATFVRILAEKRAANDAMCQRLESGLKKLEEAGVQLAELNEQLAVQNEAVKSKTEACNKLLEGITVSTAQAEEKKEQAQLKEKDLELQNIQIAKDKEEAEQALAAALPALEEARAALSNLSSAEITEIRSFAKPPKEVQKVCECVCVVKNVKDTSWKSAKGMVSFQDLQLKFENKIFHSIYCRRCRRQISNLR
jgi:dynein heavy chain